MKTYICADYQVMGLVLDIICFKYEVSDVRIVRIRYRWTIIVSVNDVIDKEIIETVPGVTRGN
jgi:hypothetical protein